MSHNSHNASTTADYGQTRTATESTPASAAVVGGGRGNIKEELIVGILSQKPVTTARGISRSMGQRSMPYSKEELSEMPVSRLWEIYRNQQNPLPLTSRYDDADRELAQRCSEYKQRLREVNENSNEQGDEADAIEPVDLTELE